MIKTSSKPVIKDKKKQNIQQTTLQGKAIKVRLIPIGAAIVALEVKDKDGHWQDVVLGYDDLDHYLKYNEPAIGVVHALLSNRTKNASFSLENQNYHLHKNVAPHALHAGDIRSKHFESRPIDEKDKKGICYYYQTSDLFEGLPGPSKISIAYYLDQDDLFYIDYQVEAQQNTIVANLTNHSYFNLDGCTKEGLKNHHLELAASNYVDIDQDYIPSGKIKPLSQAMDFSISKGIDPLCDQHNEPMASAGGYDFHYVLDTKLVRKTLAQQPVIATLASKKTGIVMELATSYPGVQLYTANSLDQVGGKNNCHYQKHSSVCLETQYHPDAINNPNFPDIRILPYQKQHNISVYRFSTQTTA